MKAEFVILRAKGVEGPWEVYNPSTPFPSLKEAEKYVVYVSLENYKTYYYKIEKVWTR